MRALARVKAGATDAPTARQTIFAPFAGKVKAGDEKAVGKRKREVLVEVTGVSNNNRKTKDEGKGKEKEAVGEGMPVKPKPSGKIVTRPNPAVAAHKSSRSTSTNLAIAQGASDSTSVAQVAPPAVFARKTSLRAIDEGEDDRAAKRRHTEEPTRRTEDDSQAEADRIAAELVDLGQEVEIEVDATKEKKQEWDDLDAGDWDDPMMVSEYVAEVCIYLKEIEVRVNLVYKSRTLTRTLADTNASEPSLYGKST
ncbi:hypothetical protein C0992_000442 [Termitomyces sp. T32_za158]|nr:hypothetical protein C0992_000442 [Termitomyces sp. T32_za158]